MKKEYVWKTAESPFSSQFFWLFDTDFYFSTFYLYFQIAVSFFAKKSASAIWLNKIWQCRRKSFYVSSRAFISFSPLYIIWLLEMRKLNESFQKYKRLWHNIRKSLHIFEKFYKFLLNYLIKLIIQFNSLLQLLRLCNIRWVFFSIL